MKFYSYSNQNENYTKAISLENIRTFKIDESTGKSVIRFGIRVDYIDKHFESLPYLEEAEAKKVYNEILNLLNK